MKPLILTFPLALTVLYSTAVYAEASPHSKYAGQEKRQIKSLSADDINQLSQGKGWGLSKAAELNGVPGPAHLLELKDKINLSQKQEDQIRALFQKMKAAAIPLGKMLVKREKILNDSFANKTVTENSLRRMLDNISDTRKALRYVHLTAHLAASKLLSTHQIKQYNTLRGYGNGSKHSSHRHHNGS